MKECINCECYKCKNRNDCFECRSCRNHENFTDESKTKCMDRKIDK